MNILREALIEAKAKIAAGEIDLRDVGKILFGIFDQDMAAAMIDAALAAAPCQTLREALEEIDRQVTDMLPRAISGEQMSLSAFLNWLQETTRAALSAPQAPGMELGDEVGYSPFGRNAPQAPGVDELRARVTELENEQGMTDRYYKEQAARIQQLETALADAREWIAQHVPVASNHRLIIRIDALLAGSKP